MVPDWNCIVREHGPMVFGTAWRVLGHVADCEDVVQEVFLQAHCLRQKEAVRNWPGLLRWLALIGRSIGCDSAGAPCRSTA